MGKIKLNIKNIALILLIVILAVGIFFIFNGLKEEEKISTQVQTQKVTKVEEKTYSKTITLNTFISPTLANTMPSITNASPTASLLTKNSISPTITLKPTLKLMPTNDISPTEVSTPSPTDVFVVANRPTVTATFSAQSQITPTPTRVTKLPIAGNLLYPSIFLFVAGFIVIVSLIF